MRENKKSEKKKTKISDTKCAERHAFKDLVTMRGSYYMKRKLEISEKNRIRIIVC